MMKMELVYLALMNTSSAHEKKCRQIYQEMGLSTGQPKILWILSYNEGCLQKKLAELAHVEQPTMTALLKGMESKNWIRREQTYVSGGKRAYRLYLTEEGKAMVRQVEGVVAQMEAINTKGLTPEEIDTLLELLFKVEYNLRNS